MRSIKQISILLAVLFARCQLCIAQDTTLLKSSEWRIYAVSGRSAMSVSLDSLMQIRSIKIDSSLVKVFVGTAVAWEKGKYSVWMGAYAATARIKGQLRKFVLSSYGGFFYDMDARRYYEIAEENKKDWHDLLNTAAEKLDTASARSNK